MKYKPIRNTRILKTRGKTFILTAMLLVSGMAQAQILIEGNVFGGGNIGEVDGNTTVTVNGGTVGKKIPLIDRTVDQNLQFHSRVEYGNVYGGGNGYDKSITIEPNVVPGFSLRAGLVTGNTNVTIQGNAVVRRAVYGGGNMASVGNYTEGGEYAPAEGKGQTTVTITGNALIGPAKNDLTNPTDAELIQAATDFHMESGMTAAQYTDTAFRYLGSNEGWVFGSSRGLAGDALKEYSFVDTTEIVINDHAQALNVFGSGENGHVKRGTNVLIAGNAIIGGVPLHNTGYTIPRGTFSDNDVTVHLYDSDGELVEDEFGVGRLVTRGNVLGGGKGTDFISWLNNPTYSYSAGRAYGNATVEIQGNALIYNCVFGGGLIASVGTFTEDANHAITGVEEGTGLAKVTISGGTIGSPDSDGLNNGEVYGGGRGLPGRRSANPSSIDPLHQALDLAYVGHTHVTIDGGFVMNSVYGGAANGHVQGNSHVIIKETDSSKPTTIGLVGIGGWHGNVFAGGGGTTRYKDNNTLNLSITAGRVFGNTYLEMTGGHVLHNVYGGGAIASVGTYDASEVVNPTHPYLGFGHSYITITGGEIGTNGNNNGMVFGSGRGQIAEPGNFLDYVTYVAYSEVNIGQATTTTTTTGEGEEEVTTTTTTYSGNAKINGSVYGSGENGHTYLEAVVNVYSGTIGIAAADYDPEEPDPNFLFRGNVYGAGCGTDMYDTNNDGVGDTYNPLSGVVQGNTEVNIYGGYISRNVYGGGAMASVGSINHPHTVKHLYVNHESEPSLSWPYELEYTTITDSINHPVSTGKTVVNVKGGHIGTVAAPIAECGNVFGSSRGDVGPLGVMDTLAIVRETEVNINFTPSGTSIGDGTTNCIVGSVYGSGENGTVYENTKVTIDNGIIGGSVFGGGDGTDTYMVALKDPSDPTGATYLNPSPQRSITSGKVYGNTEIVINGGQVMHNVYGGGNLASVGKGNYMGYGEMTTEDVIPDPYENSGTSKVTINGGTIGTTGYSGDDGYNNGYVFGSSKGTAFKTVNNTPRYDYSRDFFLGYTNKTIVNIGSTEGEGTGPEIKGSVFGGGDDGHVRWHTNVNVNKGNIGAEYDPTDGSITDDKWAYRGNVYGAGRGVDKYDSDGNGTTDSYCTSAGSVTLNTNVTVNGGTIHRNVYGGGSMATVGPPPTGYDPGTSTCTVNIYGGTIGQVVTPTGEDPFNYGGNVYGAGRGIIDPLAPLTRFASASNAVVNVDNGSGTVIGNVYGGGSYGQVKEETNVNMIGGSVEGSIFGGGMGIETEEIAGLVAGNATVDMTGGTVKRSVYGGGQMGSVGTFNAYNNVTYNAGQSNAFTVQVPTACEANTGLATVTMSGGSVGLNGSLMPWTNHNPDDDDRGWIFCGGQGVADSITYPKAIALGVVNCTHLQISNTTSGENTIRPVVTASVYGGAENGLVLDSTFVEIAGGQIGTGHYKTGNTHSFDPIYSEANWEAAITAINDGTIETALGTGSLNGVFHECDAWEYGDNDGNIKVYDINYGKHIIPDDPSSALYEPEITALQGTNGHSFFGNVFGGGSGYYPIAPGKWRPTAGQVNGNTRVKITGGHILTAVYGGNETTDVVGKSTIEMSDGTVGIPRTMASIQARPVNGNIFGAGMGDPRTMFNAMTNVKKTQVYITGGTVFGNVYGGSREGHVLDSTLVVIGQEDGKSTLIGTTGFSGYDGLVYGGGRGKDQLLVSDTIGGRRQFPVGRVGGNTHITMSKGKVLGNLYGGGQVGLVGVDEDGWITSFVQEAVYDSIYHGLSKVEVSGGTIGNFAHDGDDLLTSNQTAGNVYGGGRGDLKEFIEDDLGRVAKSIVNISGNPAIYGSVFGGGQMANVGYWIGYDVGYAIGTSASGVNIIGAPIIGTAHEFGLYDPDHQKMQYDTINGMRMISHTRTGNVFGGGQGNIQVVKDNTNRYHVLGLEHGHCGKTKVSIGMDNGTSGGQIFGSVFGGSEQGAVWGDTKVTVAGGTIGKENIVCDTLKYVNEHWVFVQSDYSTYSYGSVYGGSYGADIYKHFNINDALQPVIDSVNLLAGRVYGNTTVEITGGAVRGNVFGGGDIASVGEWNSSFVPTANTGKATVTIGGSAVIGPLDWTGLNAYVYGGGKGFPSDPDELRKTHANLNDTKVIVNGGTISGSIFGGGSDSHVLGGTEINVHSDANIGTNGLTTWDGNIFGGGRNFLNTNHTNGRVAGNIKIEMDGGTMQGTIFGGGRLALSGVNVDGEFPNNATTWNPTDHGNVTINVSGGEIGNGSDQGVHLLTENNESVGDIFGGGKGDTKNYEDILAGRVTNTQITVTGNTRIHGAVFGGGEMASIGWWNNDGFINNTGAANITIGTLNGSVNPEIGTYLELNPAYLNDQFTLGGTTYPHSDWTVFETEGGVRKLLHTCTGNVIGGCQGDVDFEDWVDGDSDTWNNWPYMGRSRTSTITINGGTIMSDVFGGPEQGTMDGDAHVTVNGGTIGRLVTTSNREQYYFGGVYGAGYGSDDPSENDHSISVDGVTMTAKDRAGRVYGNILVEVMGGEVRGDVFGGANYAYVGDGTTANKGNVEVFIGNEGQYDQPNVGTTLRSRVFGANNHSGTPFGDVEVHIISTAHTTDNIYPTIPSYLHTDDEKLAWLESLPDEEEYFAIKDVYGGSNLADYTPMSGKKAWVKVYDCNENTIGRVFGGSNAANVGRSTGYETDSYVIIDGGRIGDVFGGGNGEVIAANTYGTANTTINGGLINNVFGAGNAQGTVNATNLVINENGDCPLYINNIFGGGNIAPIIGDVVTTVECGEGSYDNFYGGSNFADIYGNVTVNIFGGTYNRLFGGSRGASDNGADIRSFPSYDELLADYELPVGERQYSQSLRDYMHFDPTDDTGFASELVGEGGNVTTNLFGGTINEAAFGGSHINGVIHGKIQVNVFDASNCGLDLEDLYGAGCDTPYEPIYALEQGEEIRLSPEVNIIHGTVKGNVFGGGQGLTANTVGTNPVVNMGYYDAMGTTSIEGSLIDRLVDTVGAHHYSVPTSYIAQVGRNYTNIEAYNGKGNIYGGGELAQVTDSTFVYIHTGTVKGSVYGGGKGQASLIVNEADTVAGRVRGNTLVDMTGGLVERSIYGGGELGSVGTFTEFYTAATGGHVAGEPKTCKPNTGFAKVRISGGQVGKNEALMPTTLNPHNDEYGYVFCGGKGVADSLTYPMANLLAVVDRTYLEIKNTTTGTTSIRPLVTASVYGGSENGLVLGNTHVKMTGGQIGTGCYQDNSGNYHWDGLYDEDKWTAAKTAINDGTIGTALGPGGSLYEFFHECDHWPYGRDTDDDGEPDVFEIYDIFANQYDSHGGALAGSNGHSFFGNLFGGGSGFYPFWDAVNDTAVWRCSAGRVWGNTLVEIEGGHILTSVYGGNEVSDVMGKATINMTGGTIGVPRTIASIKAHPVTCYLFGAGMGDPRIMFNTWTNVANAEVNISGNAFLFGSAFGGGEDGHVLGNVTVNIGSSENPSSDHVHIGTWGYSYVDGNVFGGGRGFDGNALTAGSVGGNVTLNIYSGTMLGSIYGGGRLASVGCGFTASTDPNYGQMQPGIDHGNVRVNISGGTIGNDYESKLHLGNPALANGHSYGGNVYGGSMGRLTLLNGDVNPLWPNLGKVKNTFVTISGANTIIKGSVYGGSELGTLSSNAEDVAADRVSGRAFVKVEDGTIWRNVFGGSYGSDIDDPDMFAPLDVQTQETPYMVSPMQRAGRIDGNTRVEIKGGWVKKGVYGGGELASVGTITEEPVKHEDETQCFALSWPYEFKYAEGTGYDTVIINNGRVGITGKDYMGPWNTAGEPIYYAEDDENQLTPIPYDLTTTAGADALKNKREDNGDVFGGSKGKAGDRYEMAHCANSNNTVVIVEYPASNTADPDNYKPDKDSPLCLGTIGGKLYDFVHHFIPTFDYNIPNLPEQSEQWLTYHERGCLPGSLYGGGENGHVNNRAYVTLNNGLVGHSVYGGGKGTDTYVTELEHDQDGPINPETGEPEWHAGDSYDAEITSITAGKVFGNTYVTMNGGYVVRNVFGGGNRASVGKGNYAGGPGDFTPQGYGEQWTSNNMYLRDTLVTYSGHAYVNINGGAVGTINGMKDDLPTGNVYGSSRGEPAPNVRQTLSPRIHYYPEFFLGYVNHTHVTIGKENETGAGPRLYGSVFGGGQDGHVRWNTEVTVNKGEIGNKYDDETIDQVGTDDLTHYQWRGRGSVYGAGAGLGMYKDATGSHFSTSAGSVTQFTEVTIKGGIIHQNVYGGGPLSSVGPPAMGQSTVPGTTYSLARVNIYSAIGDRDVVIATEHNDPSVGRYGGSVFGACRGVFDFAADPSISYDKFATTMFSEVNIFDGAEIPGSVFGGGQLGQVKNNTKVNMRGGTVGTIAARKASGSDVYTYYEHTSGGEVFGGGAGYPVHRDAAMVKGNTEVNIIGGHVLLNVYGGGEMASVGVRDTIFDGEVHDAAHIKDFSPKANTGYAKVTIKGGQVGPAPKVEGEYNIPIGLNGVDGYVFGGGKGIGDDMPGRFKELADVNYTSVTVDIPSDADQTTNRIWGSIFGGAEDGHVLGSDTVRLVSGLIGTYGTTSYDGNIFGGGRNFSKKNYTAGRTRGNITVEMTGGQLYGSIFGGGRLAMTGISYNGVINTSTSAGSYQALLNGPDHGQVFVKVSGGTVGNLDKMRDCNYSIGDVFGGGKGDKVGIAGHPASSATLISLVKDTHVEISGTARIYGSVYGGGEVSNVGNFTWNQSGTNVSNIAIASGTGHTKVTVSGGTIGMDNMQMITASGYPDDWGHVFGGSEGWVEKLTDSPVIDVEGNRLVELMASVGTTEVTIKDNAFVLGSVYGGADNGHVLDSTYVSIQGGQIGAGNQVFHEGTQTNRPYTPEEWDYAQHQSLPECASWTFGGDYDVYDINVLENGKPKPGKNGATFYGNVFGGGSGYYPYGFENGHSQWLRTAGQVRGNTRVEVSGGHILTSLYGGCETTDVLGDSTSVIMTGGTLGVPRTLAEIAAHPVTCYVFGGGKGIADSYFNTWTNVQNTHVNIKGGWIYGSVFGGGEDGHVKNNVIVDVAGTIGTNEQAMAGEATKIGTWGTSYVDGNIFGGGRGFAGDQITAGAVGGNINVNIKGGAMLGSIYGGGRMASTGINYTDPTNLGQFSEDGEGKTYGYINVDISGGTIGNEHEYVYANPEATPTQMETWQAAHNMPYTEFDANNKNHLSRTKGGNVFGGPMGRLTKMDGTTINPFWPSLGKAKQTTVVVRGDAVVKSSVYGGGEFGTVRNNATVRIQGGTVGTKIANPNYNPENPGNAEEQYHYGSVYGGGFGSRDLEYTGAYANDSTANGLYKRPVEIAGRVYGNTFVYIEGGQVLENVFGGGELASIGMVKNGAMVNGVATVEMTGGQVGPLDMTGLNAYVYGGSEGIPDHGYKAYCNVNSTSLTVDMDLYDDEHDTGDRVWGSLFGGGSDGHVLGNASVLMRQGTLGTTGITSWDGNIFGGGRNYSAVSETAGRVGGNIEVTVTGGHLLGSVFGGGRLGSVGIDEDGDMQEDAGANTYGYTTVNIGSDDDQNEIIIGHLIYDEQHPDERVGGNVYGGGKGIAGPPSSIYPRLAKVKQTEVNIKEQSGKETWIEGSVFGGGEDGHVLQDTYVNIYDGQIGGKSFNSLEPCADVYHGNVYGGGRGIDTYEHEGAQIHSHTAGWVQGNTNVNMVGGHVVRNVYGGGNIASVGIADEPDPAPGEDYKTGLASVTITGGTVGTIHEDENYGNVFGSGHGGVGGEYVNLAFVKNTHVTIGGGANTRVFGSVFGGGEDGHVRMNTLVDIEGGIIGDADDANPSSTYYNPLDGNVYGGGRGLLTTVESETAGEVRGHTTVNIRKSTDGVTEYSPIVWNNVYGGGSQSVVKEYKVVNMSGGLVHGSMFGGSREIPASRHNMAPRWVNMWGGTVEGNVYGCSYFAEDGDPAHDEDWASFVNISGGTIGTDANGGIEGGNVYGAGYGGKVKGSVAVLIGQKAIVETSNESGDEFYGINIHRPTTPTIANLDIKGSVFGGSYGSIGSTDWDHSFNVSGYSRVYIDGTGYNTTAETPDSNTNDYMNIGGGVYGCGTNCESGEEGRNILVRNYGTRNPGGSASAELTQASRTLTTLQRGDIIMLDNTNVNLSGADDISQSDSERKFAVLQVDKGVYVTNASGIVLGAVGAPAYMDSIHEVRSLYLKDNTGTSYDQMNSDDNANWEWIGIKDNDNHLYRIHATGDPTQLETEEENVIIFNGDSRLYVRYLDESGSTKKRMYGLLQGFFRMRGDNFQPYGTESFAYARPKVTPKNNPIAVDGYDFTSDILNGSDGGFLSYVTDYNFFTQANHTVLNYTYHYEGDDGGSEFTKTKQYPYFNIGEYVQNRADGEMDLEEFREWVLPVISGRIWYVDGRGIGTGGWGKDRNHQDGWGHFPDKPKLTVSGDKTVTEGENTVLEQGICYDESIIPEPRYPAFDKANDIIYVVGPVEAVLENDNLNRWPDYQLKLYRYPGGHLMSNGYYDETVVDAEHPATAPDNVYTWNGQTGNSTVGPGANLGMMIHANKSNFVMENVLVDGLYGATTTDVTTHSIPTSFTSTQVYKVNKPMVVTTANAALTLKGYKNTLNEEIVANGTILQRGYNGIDVADTWYNNVDYIASAGVHDGGGLFVDKDASCTVNVEGLVTIQGNKQRHVVGSNDHPVNCNVYLPTFSKHLNIIDELEKETHIGVTSPIRNTAEWYYDNTFSPVAEVVPAASATMEAKAIASQTWQNCNFNDDQGWFFVNENVENHKRTTYYDGTVTTSTNENETIITPNPTNPNLNENTLFFGWTWANVVRANPGDNSIEEVNEGSTTTFKIKDEKGLAWLISMTSGMNGVGYSSTDFSSNSQHPKFIKQTDDINLKQYVWVPIGSPADGNHKQFAGNFDGQGHLITDLYIEYIGVGDSIYERHDYGLFGNTFKCSVNRTFVVSGKVNPVIAAASTFNPAITDVNTFNIGGLVGCLDMGSVTNSEAAVEMGCPDKNGSGIIAGGLVAKVESGVVHSSMAMPEMHIGASSSGPMGGLVGSASNNSVIKNSFVNALISINQSNQSVKAAGLLGRSSGTEMKNSYAHIRNELTNSPVFKGIVNQLTGSNTIDYCYVEDGYAIDSDECGENSHNYTFTTSPDNLGYMYYDNIIENDTTLVGRLNLNAWSMNPSTDTTYAHWARPGLAEINGDLPVLLLCEFDGDSIYQGQFRSVGTYEGGRALQYGGPVRDGDDNELDAALTREQVGTDKDCLFVYGDVRSVGSSLIISQAKVSYQEDVSILSPGKLSEFANNYVGISFDNSCGSATSTPGVNYGLIGMGGYLLPRDWHMFSTPLSNAPQGFDYGTDNYNGGPSNNPWVSTANEFNWLTQAGSDECATGADYRYWMKTFNESDQTTDGYFPTTRGSLFTGSAINDLFITGDDSDECPTAGMYRYPYGMDFYTWNEPQYHWINFKRNGPNHWHSDTPHVQLNYVNEVATNHSTAQTNVNEETLISGKGYMAAITKETFMQSHGYLNGDVNNAGQFINLTNTSSSLMPGWNLVGNPYHGYLDFVEVAKGTNLDALSDQNYLSEYADEGAFYVVYNADKFDGDDAATAFRYYPVRGSIGGDYADRYLHPHQGFYVRAKDNKPLRFKESMLATRATVDKNGEESHFRDESPAYPLVNLYLSSDQGCADVTVIEFERPNWGGATKIKELRVGDGLFYAQHDNTHFAALFAQQGIDRVPLWFEAKEDDIFTIKWNTANGDFQSMYLIDNKAGVQYDMLRNNSYTFEGHKGDYPSRFLIVFNVTDVEEHLEINNFVFFDGSQWMVTGDGQLEFIDLNGQVLWEKKVTGGQTRVTVPEVASGMYLFRLTNGKETKVQKVIVNR